MGIAPPPVGLEKSYFLPVLASTQTLGAFPRFRVLCFLGDGTGYTRRDSWQQFNHLSDISTLSVTGTPLLDGIIAPVA
jgi:hypothetical protein